MKKPSLFPLLVLNASLPGLGQLFCRRYLRGGIFILLSVVLFFSCLFCVLYPIYSTVAAFLADSSIQEPPIKLIPWKPFALSFSMLILLILISCADLIIFKLDTGKDSE